MTIWRLDQLLLRMFDQYGPVWPIVTVLCLLFLLFGRLSRAFMLGLAIQLGSMVWYRPLVALAHVLRWWIFAVLAIRGVMYVISVGDDVPRVGKVPRSVILLGLMALASSLWARNFVFSFVVSGTFACTLVLCFVVAWRLLDTDDVLRGLCVAALIVALLMQGVGCILGLIAIITRDPYLLFHTDVEKRFAGVMLNANGNGVFGAVLWPLVLAAPREYLRRLAWLRWPALVALIVCIVFSGSRTAVGVTLMTTFVYALYRFRAGAVVTTALVGGVGVALLLSTPLEELEGDVQGSALDTVVLRSDTLSDFGGRLERWQLGWDTAMEKPWFGHGWGASRTLGDTDVERSLELGRIKAATNLHSTHVSLLVDLGFVGLGLFWLFSAGVIAAGLRLLAAPITPLSTVSVLFFASTLGMLADTIVHNGILSAGSPNSIIFWFSSALVIKQSQRIAPWSLPLPSAADGEGDGGGADVGPPDIDDRPPAHPGEDV